MKQILLAVVLIAVPVAAFTAPQMYYSTAARSAASLGDMSSFKTIIADVQAIAKSGDFTAAERRITDFETAWDDAEDKLRPLNKAAWGNVDDAADAALHALRATAPDAAGVGHTLTGLMAALDSPSGTGGQAGGIRLVSSIAVTDESGHAIACEEMLAALRTAIDGGKIAAADIAAAKDFQSMATERCNADDDAHADEFSAQGLALASQAQ